MKIDDIKIGDLEKIFEFYNQYCGEFNMQVANIKLDEILMQIKNKDFITKVGYRLGSIWSGSSCLRFRFQNNDVIPVFDPNMQESDMFYDEAQEFSKEINAKLLDYVNNL